MSSGSASKTRVSKVVDERGEVWTRSVSWHDRASVSAAVGASAAPRAAGAPVPAGCHRRHVQRLLQTCAVTLTVEITGTPRPLITGIEAYSGSAGGVGFDVHSPNRSARRAHGNGFDLQTMRQWPARGGWQPGDRERSRSRYRSGSWMRHGKGAATCHDRRFSISLPDLGSRRSPGLPTVTRFRRR